VYHVANTLNVLHLSRYIIFILFSVFISQDGASIMKQLQVNQPAAAMLVEGCLSLDASVGDGTTSCAILAASLM